MIIVISVGSMVLDSHNWNTFENAPIPLEREATMRRFIYQVISDRNGKPPIFEREWKGRSVPTGHTGCLFHELSYFFAYNN